jgi:hypothetical protein
MNVSIDPDPEASFKAPEVSKLGLKDQPRSAKAMNLLYQRIGGREGILNLLRHFYADVRQDPVIGPVFNARLKIGKHTWKSLPASGKHSSVDHERTPGQCR